MLPLARGYDSIGGGTYTLTRGRIASPAYDAVTGTLNINDSLNHHRNGGWQRQSDLIITWGALTSGLSVDMIIAVNEDITILSNATASISNVVIQNWRQPRCVTAMTVTAAAWNSIPAPAATPISR